jgi:hypothetical protein
MKHGTRNRVTFGEYITWRTQRASLFLDSRKLSWLVICLGIVFRLAQYQTNRSLWADEACLALNIVNRTFSELLQPLDYNQGAPIGFLIVEKLAIQTFGNNEYVLRMFPLVSGIVSLFLFYSVATCYVNPRTALIALVLFAASGPLIYYSSEVKQYSSDVVIGLLLYWTYWRTIHVHSERLGIPRLSLFGVLGAIAIWFSHPAVFILAGIGGSLALFCLVRKEWARIGRLSTAYLLWVLSFAVVYLVSFRDLTSSERLRNFWSFGFMPFPPLSFSDIRWFVKTFFGIFEHPVGLTLTGLGAFTFFIGSTLVFSKAKEHFLILTSPILFTLLASGFAKYPFRGRLLLFIAPLVLILIAAGIEHITDKARRNSRLIEVTLVGLLLFHPLLSASYHLVEPRTHVGGYEVLTEIKPVMRYVREHQQDGDVLHVYRGLWAAFKYYQDNYGYEDGDYIAVSFSEGDWNNCITSLDKLRGNERIWFLFSYFQSQADHAEVEFYLYYLDSIGTRLDSFESQGAVAYLYNLSKNAKTDIHPVGVQE